MSNHNISVCEE